MQICIVSIFGSFCTQKYIQGYYVVMTFFMDEQIIIFNISSSMYLSIFLDEMSASTSGAPAQEF